MNAIHHTGLAVTSIEEKLPFYINGLGMKQLTEIIFDPIQKVRVVLLGYNSDDQHPPFIELVEPAGSSTPIDRFLKNNISIYHFCIEVPDISEALLTARANKSMIIQQPVPAILFNNRKIAWVLTPDKYLIEFLER
jgi:methylmalonyl-CoA/ethylmalonyl-CoA epimerase